MTIYAFLQIELNRNSPVQNKATIKQKQLQKVTITAIKCKNDRPLGPDANTVCQK